MRGAVIGLVTLGLWSCGGDADTGTTSMTGGAAKESGSDDCDTTRGKPRDFDGATTVT